MNIRVIRVVVFALLLAGCQEPDPNIKSQSEFQLDPSQPFSFELGRGSGRDGLDIVSIDQTGKVDLRQIDLSSQNTQRFVAGSMRLSQQQTADFVKDVNRSHLTSLKTGYIDRRIIDGTQWVLYIEQGNHRSSVYFSNQFPTAMTDVAKNLDAVLASAGMSSITWTAMSEEDGRKAQNAMWQRIEGKTNRKPSSAAFGNGN